MPKITSSECLSDEETAQEYPLMKKFFKGTDIFGQPECRIQRMDGPRMSRAHYIFAPIIEQALESAAKEKLWEAFEFEVKVKRKPRRK